MLATLESINPLRPCFACPSRSGKASGAHGRHAEPPACNSVIPRQVRARFLTAACGCSSTAKSNTQSPRKQTPSRTSFDGGTEIVVFQGLPSPPRSSCAGWLSCSGSAETPGSSSLFSSESGGCSSSVRRPSTSGCMTSRAQGNVPGPVVAMLPMPMSLGMRNCSQRETQQFCGG